MSRDISMEGHGWVALCEQLMSELSAYVGYIPAMNPTEVKAVIEAVNEAMLTHQKAIAFDERVERFGRDVRMDDWY